MGYSSYLDEHHGGSRPWLLNIWLRCSDRISGRYADLRSIDWPRVDRLVFCCWGNICRSAYADARAEQRGIHAASFGLRTTAGKPAIDRTVVAAAERGIKLEGHRTDELSTLELTAGDLVLAAEPEQLSLIPADCPAQLSLLGLWHPSDERPLLQDPYGRELAYFRRCFAYIDECVAHIDGLLGEQSASRSA